MPAFDPVGRPLEESVAHGNMEESAEEHAK
jgi:hypothetical protein